MALPEQLAPVDAEARRLVLIVTGAHLRAEAADRPLAYQLRQRVIDWRDRRFDGAEAPLHALVCSDVWRLNSEDLWECPTVSVGGPAVNALTAHWTDKLDSALVVDEKMLVQVDVEFADLRACCWGASRADTRAAVDAFAERYLDGFLTAAARRVGESV